MAGEMKLPDARGGDPVEVVQRIKSVVERIDVNIVDIEKQTAIGGFGNPAQELPFGHFRLPEADVAGCVLEEDPAAKEVLNDAHAIDDMTRGLLGVRER